jgi:hypothetical protein
MNLRFVVPIVLSVMAIARLAQARMITYPYPIPARPIGAGRRNNRSGYNSPMAERWPRFGSGNLADLIAWLDVDRSTRWARDGHRTYCDHYFGDFFDQLYGPNVVYIPAWRTWTDSAVERLRAGEQLTADSTTTVERNASGVNRWLREHGEAFGWRRFASADELRAYVNRTGRPGAISTDTHVAVVVPDALAPAESPHPLLSQAGGANFRYGRTSSWYSRNPNRLFVAWDNRA